MQWQQGGISQLNDFAQQGWIISGRLSSQLAGSDMYYVYELKRQITD